MGQRWVERKKERGPGGDGLDFCWRGNWPGGQLWWGPLYGDMVKVLAYIFSGVFASLLYDICVLILFDSKNYLLKFCFIAMQKMCLN